MREDETARLVWMLNEKCPSLFFHRFKISSCSLTYCVSLPFIFFLYFLAIRLQNFLLCDVFIKEMKTNWDVSKKKMRISDWKQKECGSWVDLLKLVLTLIVWVMKLAKRLLRDSCSYFTENKICHIKTFYSLIHKILVGKFIYKFPWKKFMAIKLCS